MAKRAIWALFLAVPLCFLGTAVGDNVNCPDRLRTLISPGFAWALYFHFSGGFAQQLSTFVRTGLALNFAFYFWLIFGLCCLLPRPRSIRGH